jgi:hypothetical protein
MSSTRYSVQYGGFSVRRRCGLRPSPTVTKRRRVYPLQPSGHDDKNEPSKTEEVFEPVIMFNQHVEKMAAVDFHLSYILLDTISERYMEVLT